MISCKLRTEYHIQLYNAIKTNKTINELKLHHVHLLPKATTSLSELLISNHNITRLMVRDCGIDDREMDDLSKGIKSHKLEHLDLRNNIFEDEGLKTLMEAL
jgi:Ran GTPase-activating protein (RanGAP) involved in mRNA processing and transport